ncbi:neprilysin-2-like isoform X2 [Anoplophora glabripennis]|uniref:neprilysin-2-like isoform X2 n=1 Tax=Anoplophora glabripennis TaxID=217634 RepID=UPI000874058E|nr:neprilysin-2-like isoform X2 [Anoplophora glabripennis]
MQGYTFQKRQKGRRWMKWKNVLIAVIYLVLVCSIIIGAIYLYPRLRLAEQEDDICLTENCLKAALHIVSSMDVSQDPCYDFYQFTCGSFMEKVHEKNSPSQYYTQKLNTANKLNAIIAEPITGDEEGIYLQQKKFYQSCMDVTAIDEEGLEPFMNLLGELGGWPILEGQNWKEEDFKLNEFIIKCMEFGLPFQWFFELTFNDNRLGIHPPKIIKHNGYYKESAYLNLMIETAIDLGASSTIALNEMGRILEFEKDLESIAVSQDITIFPLYELNSTVPALPWLDFLINVVKDYMYQGDDSEILLDETYLRQLNLLLAETPKRVQADFIIWKIVQEFGFYLAKPVRENLLNFTNLMVHEQQQINTRFKFCIAESIARFPRIAEARFIQRYINEDRIETIRDMISNIKNQFVNRLNAADWIDEGTKEAGINKVNNIVEIISQHSLDFDENILKDFLKLSDLEFTTSNPIDMIREKNKDVLRQQLETENITQVDFLTKFFFSKTFNIYAAYMERENFICIIQDVFLDSGRPNYLNYGALGSIVGHEIAHAFSKVATTHDSEEEQEIIATWLNSTSETINELYFLNTTDLWQYDNLEALISRMRCISPELATSENDETLISENFADLVGIDVAYEAYVAWAEQYEKEQQLPGLSFSPSQLFWIQFGAVNCYKHLDSVPWTVDKDTHSTMRYRVINALKNSENFAKDFECPEASVMNPLEKCHVF